MLGFGGPRRCVARATSRWFATTQGQGSAETPSLFSSAHLQVTATSSPKPKPTNDALLGMFGKFFSDHMLEADWSKEHGWAAPRVHPFGDIALSPASSCLHYALQCFEGMKAYRGDDGRLRLFRPELNAKRLNSSLRRLVMPEIPEEGFVDCLKRFVRQDADWVPRGPGYSAYLRPTVVSTEPYLGVSAPSRAKFFALLSPVGPYWPDGFKPITVSAETHAVRAWPGGAGFAKIGGNYAITIQPQTKAAAAFRANQVLYCTPDGMGAHDGSGVAHRITEVGSMNIFVAVRARDGRTELVTPSLARDDILPGVTRRSVLDLATALQADLGLDAVLEQDLFLHDLQDAHAEGRLLEVFGAGTAAIVCPIKSIVVPTTDDAESTPTSAFASIDLPTGDEAGPIATTLLDHLSAVHYGRNDPFGWATLVD